MLKKNKNAAVYMLYTILFGILSSFIFQGFYQNGKAFIWKIDGLYQHYNALAYYGEYLRSIIQNLFQNGRIEIPLWDFSIGYGSDIITTLHYYVVGDPINLFSVFFIPEKTEALYHILIVLRLYLAGVSFLIYCRRMKKNMSTALIGSVIYIFCGYALNAAVKHPYFVTPMIYLPLLLIGIEKVMKKERPYLFIGMVFLSTISNFYFFYMLTILIFIYAFIRFIYMNHDKWYVDLLKLLGQFSVYYLSGLLMACIIFYPVISQMLSTDRVDAETSVNLMYSMAYYKNLFNGVTTAGHMGNWTYLGYAAIVIPVVAEAVLQIKQKRELVTAGVILSFFLLLPMAGHIFNGFSYVSNRWIFGYSFLLAYAVVDVLPDILHLKFSRLVIINGISLLYIMGSLILNRRGAANDIWPSVFLVLIVCILTFSWWINIRKPEKNLILKPYLMGAIGVIVCANVIINAVFLYSEEGLNYLAEFYERGQAQDMLENNSADLDLDEDFHRYESNPYGQKKIYNSELQTGRYGTSYFFSLANDNIYSYMRDHEVNINREFMYIGQDGRTMLGTLASERYFEVAEGKENYLPYGYVGKAYSYQQQDETTINGYRNQYNLPLGYTYESVISFERYTSLTTSQKQQALMQGAVVEGEIEQIKKTELLFEDKELDYIIESTKGLKIDGDEIIVEESDAAMVLSFDDITDSELYIQFENIYYDKADVTGRKQTQIKVTSENLSKEFKISTPYFSWYEGRHDYTINLGYNETTRNKVEIKFDRDGVYTISDIKIIAQSMNNYPSQVEALKADTLQNIIIGTNTVTGNIQLDQSKILCLSIPYSEGWTLYVNGEKTDLLQINTMYMGTLLQEGNSEIELKYTTPGLKTGAILSLAGILLFAVIIIYEKKKVKQ